MSVPPVEQEHLRVPWGPVDAVVVWILQAFVLGLLVFAAISGLNGNVHEITGGILTELLTGGVAYAWVRLRFNSGLQTLGFKKERAVADFCYGLGFGFLSWAVASPLVGSITLAIARMVAGHRVSSPDQIQLKAPSGLAVFMFSFIAVILAPICEEIMFRGFIYQGMRSRLTFLGAAAVSSGIFMLAHAPFLLIFPSIFVFGFLQVYLFNKRGSIVSTIAAHMVFNGIAIAIYVSGH